jgi:hypothetical protein
MLQSCALKPMFLQFIHQRMIVLYFISDRIRHLKRRTFAVEYGTKYILTKFKNLITFHIDVLCLIGAVLIILHCINNSKLFKIFSKHIRTIFFYSQSLLISEAYVQTFRGFVE